ncbi:MAG: ATP-binding protein [Proteobacteria bacterium]|nr:ATP-binding protein [Pseudomonadota bacterium]
MNKLLARQLKKLGLSETQMPSTMEDWQAFVSTIETTYKQVEEDRYLLERSLQISSREISERIDQNKELVRQLANTEKIASLGTLASGVAHELNNPLAILKGYIDVTLDKGNLNDFQTNCMNKSLKVIVRMSKIIEVLRSLVHDDIGNRYRVVLTDAIENALELLAEKIKSLNITINIENQKVLAVAIQADPRQIESVIVKIVKNSLDAFEDRNIAEPRIITISGTLNDSLIPHIKLSISDNAGGIAESIISQVFDPFFSTKPVGSGMGLGLTVASRIIHNHNGKMDLQSGNDKTTTISITLPILESKSDNSDGHSDQTEKKSQSNAGPSNGNKAG